MKIVDSSDDQSNFHLEDLNMKKMLPLLGLAALTMIAISATSADAIIDLGHIIPDQPQNGGAAPEIDPSALGSAIALVMGGIAVLSDRFRR